MNLRTCAAIEIVCGLAPHKIIYSRSSNSLVMKNLVSLIKHLNNVEKTVSYYPKEKRIFRETKIIELNKFTNLTRCTNERTNENVVSCPTALKYSNRKTELRSLRELKLYCCFCLDTLGTQRHSAC